MDVIAQAKQAYLQQGATSVFVLPYPYARGHFRVCYGAQRTEYTFLSEQELLDALHAHARPVGEKSACCVSLDLPTLRARTYARLLQGQAQEVVTALTEQEKLLVRLLLDGKSAYARGQALELLARMYSIYKRSEKNLAALRACAIWLADLMQ